jgi:hypothetical protein
MWKSGVHHLLLVPHMQQRINFSASEWLLHYFMTPLCTVKLDKMARTVYPEDSTHKEEICVIETDGGEISGLTSQHK